MKPIVLILFYSVFHLALAYLLVGELYFALTVGLLYVAFLLAFYLLFLRRAMARIKRKDECTNLTRSFLFSLIASSSMNEAFESIQPLLSKGAKDELALTQEKDPYTTLESLKGYFVDPHYELFLSLLRIHSEEGGDLALVSNGFLSQSAEREKDAIREKGAKEKALAEFLSLNFVSALVLGSLRFALTGFYESVSGLSSFRLVSALYFLFSLACSLLCLSLVGEIKIEDFPLRRKNYEKAKNK